jgi:hypothetical protein
MTEDYPDKAPVKLWEHVCTVFAEMQRNSKSERVNGKHALVYEGHMTKLFRDLQLATPYYSSVLQRLKQMGCIRQLSRGGGSSQSRWELITDPDYDAFEAVETSKREGKSRLGDLEARVIGFDERLARLEKQTPLGETGS